MQIRPGKISPLGATFDGIGTNFALFSKVAEKVELCLFDTQERETRVTMLEKDSYVWHTYLTGILPGQRYGYRVYGPYDPVHGKRCNPAKLLLDPYAKAIDGTLDDNPSLYSYNLDNPDDLAHPNGLDSAPHMFKSVVINPYFDWGNDHRPATAYTDSVIYEAHVRGMTIANPRVPKEIRGTYAGMAHPSVINHLTELGITAVELMPIHQFVNDSFLLKKGLTNYWGYNTAGFFAPHNAYSSSGTCGQQVNEFKSMVKSYHAAGIEVLLDVVYNHTAEGNNKGPTLSFRGIDNEEYYRLVDDDKRHYFDTTGTGNSLLMRSPHTLQLITDSLRYWVEEMHVDGFRFDLAATLARQFQEVDKLSAFFDIVGQDPVLSQVKLIAEPWDLGSGGYQVGGFPPAWSEWNGKYRDTVRDFWRSETATLSELASRLLGSSDLYQNNGRTPVASINLVTAHDGFTLRDLVSYNDKHNDANGEDNRDGESVNRSWNCGIEGPTDNSDINALRSRQQRNFLATLLLSQGVPLISSGDEMGKTQGGNNNAYCQDNEVSWLNWDLTEAQRDLLDFTRKVITMRQAHPVLHRRRFFEGRSQEDATDQIPQVEWFDHTATVMNSNDWENMHALTVMVFLNGGTIPELDKLGEPITDDNFLLLFNAFFEPITFTLPGNQYANQWGLALDTFNPQRPKVTYEPGFLLTVQPHSLIVLESIAWEIGATGQAGQGYRT